MADRITLTVKGLRASRRKVAVLRNAVRKETKDEMEIQVKDVERDAKRIAARKTAAHQRTINSAVELNPKGVVGLVGANQVYSPDLEDPEKDLRHRSRKALRGRPTPSLLPALKRNFRRIVRGQSNAVKRAIQKAKG